MISKTQVEMLERTASGDRPYTISTSDEREPTITGWANDFDACWRIGSIRLLVELGMMKPVNLYAKTVYKITDTGIEAISDYRNGRTPAYKAGFADKKVGNPYGPRRGSEAWNAEYKRGRDEAIRLGLIKDEPDGNREWRDVVGYEGLYQVSDDGLVKNKKTGRDLARLSTMGYMKVNILKGGRSSYTFVHRLVAFAFVPNPDGKPHINHKNGLRSDNRPGNLEWCTIKENNAHARDVLKSHTVNRKRDSGRSSKDDVLQIVQMYKNGSHGTQIARSFNLDPSTVYNILRGDTWSWLTGITSGDVVRGVSEEKMEAVRRMALDWNSGMTTDELCKKYAATKKYVVSCLYLGRRRGVEVVYRGSRVSRNGGPK